MSAKEAVKMETITIPSPSVFLSSPVIKPAPEPPPLPKQRKPNTNKSAKKATSPTKKDTGVVKAKQSKSRNGMYCYTSSVRLLSVGSVNLWQDV